MLLRLVIHDVVLIDQLALDFAPGLNVLTGETGAGKSIVLDALGLALGARAETGLIRAGCAQASVTAEFALTDGALFDDIAAEQGLNLGTGIILRRLLLTDGKSRAFINDQPVSIALLKRVGDRLLEIHGQFETYGLLNARTHRGILDSFAGLQPLQQKTAAVWHAWNEAEAAHRAAQERQHKAQAEVEFLQAALAELDELAPQPDEIAQLTEKRISLQHQEKLLEALQNADALLQGETGALPALMLAGKNIARLTDKVPALAELLASIDRAIEAVGEAIQHSERQLANLANGDENLQHIEDRLFSLRAVARKHGVMPENLAQLRDDFADQLGLLDDPVDILQKLQKAATDQRQSYVKLAEELSAKRHKAALQLAKQVMQELPPLKLDRAQFFVTAEKLPEAQWNAEGMDKIAFMAATNPGSAPGPLQKVASGGELARFTLALKVVLAKSDAVPSLVFDEVDSGIGGATAAAVGERLARLGEAVQVLVVTHSPQVAARGDHHLQVSKQDKTKRPTTTVKLLAMPERVEEIARMIAGTEITPAARAAAEDLLGTKGKR